MMRSAATAACVAFSVARAEVLTYEMDEDITDSLEEPCTMELESMDYLNEVRAKGHTCPKGTTYEPNDTPLVFDCRLWLAAKLHTQDMMDSRRHSHTGSDGSTFLERAAEQGVTASAENICGGSGRDAAGAIEALLLSDGHCRNMMKKSQYLFGTGVQQWSGTVDSGERMYTDAYTWTQVFAGAAEMENLDQSCLPEERRRRLVSAGNHTSSSVVGRGSPAARDMPAPASPKL